MPFEFSAMVQKPMHDVSHSQGNDLAYATLAKNSDRTSEELTNSSVEHAAN